MANYGHGRQLNRRGSYTYGNVARNLDVVREIENIPQREIREVKKTNTDKKQGLGLFYVGYLLAMLGVVVCALVSFIRLNSDITSMAENISYYEQTLNNLTLANDDEYSKMVNTIDYDEIRRVAIEELGMVYASDDQIISYSRENSDYVRQLNNLSD